MVNNHEFKGLFFWVSVIALSILLFAGLCCIDFRAKPSLHALAMAGDTENIQRQIASGANIFGENETGFSPLHCAIQEGQALAVDCLLAAGADINQPSRVKGNTPLHLAVMKNDMLLVKKLLAAGAQLNMGNKAGYSPLCLAVDMNSPAVPLLLSAGASPDDETCSDGGYIFCAARSGCVEMLTELILSLSDLNRLSKQGVSALHYAVHGGHLETARLLIENGANVNTCDKRGWTPLHQAVRIDSFGLISLLVEKGADLEASDNQGCTPLLVAAKAGHLDGIRVLVKLGADLTAEDDQGLSVDSYALLNRRADIRSFLMEYRRNLALRGKGAPVVF